MTVEGWVFAAMMATAAGWGLLVFRAQTERQKEAARSIVRVMDMAEIDHDNLDALECAIEEYVEQRRKIMKEQQCRTKPASHSR